MDEVADEPGLFDASDAEAARAANAVDWSQYGGRTETTLQWMDRWLRWAFGSWHQTLFGSDSADAAAEKMGVLVQMGVGAGIAMFTALVVLLWFNRDWLWDPEAHAGEWHTCDDPKLKGKWHWSCCDQTDKNAKCTVNADYVKSLGEFKKQRDNLLRTVTFGRLPRRVRKRD